MNVTVGPDVSWVLDDEKNITVGDSPERYHGYAPIPEAYVTTNFRTGTTISCQCLRTRGTPNSYYKNVYFVFVESRKS